MAFIDDLADYFLELISDTDGTTFQGPQATSGGTTTQNTQTANDDSFVYILVSSLFKIIETLVSSISNGTEAIATQIISLGQEYNILAILFAIQTSFLAFRLVLDDDGFDVVTDFIRQIALYTIIFAVLNNWSGFGFGLVNFANSWMTGAVVGASATLTGANVNINVDEINDPVSAFSSIKRMFLDKSEKIIIESIDRMKKLQEELQKDPSYSLIEIDDLLFAALLLFAAVLALIIANIVLWATIGYIILFMFIGWLKALFGAAFGPLALYMLPIDRGRLLSTATSFILGGVGIYAFSLVIAMLTMNMFLAGSEFVLGKIGTSGSLSEAASRDLLFATVMVLMSILMLMVVFFARDWGAEFFGTASFDLPKVSFKRNKSKSNDDKKGGGGAKVDNGDAKVDNNSSNGSGGNAGGTNSNSSRHRVPAYSSGGGGGGGGGSGTATGNP